MNRRRTSGQALPLIAISLGALMGFAGISVDVGYLEYRQQAQQSATDAAALGGAQQLVRSNCSGATAARAAAQFDATNNAFSNGVNGVAVNPVTPPSWGPYAGNNCAISVQITTSSASTFFTRLFGYNGMAESTQAVAAVTNGGVGPASIC